MAFPPLDRHHQVLLANDIDDFEISAGTSLLDPEVARAVDLLPVYESLPVDVTDVASHAGANESNRHHTSFASVPVLEPSGIQAVQMNEAPSAETLRRGLGPLHDEPFRKAPDFYSWMKRARFFD